MWTFSIDIGGTFIKTTLVKNTMVKEKRLVATPATNQADLLKLLVELIQVYQQIEPFQLVGISVPGAIKDGDTVFHGGAVVCLNGVNLKEKLEAQAAVTVFVENDAKAAVLGEAWYGNLADVQNGAAIILGTGVGVGLWLDGTVRKGPHYQSGEVSFLIQDRQINGPESFVGVNLSAVRLVKSLAALLKCPADGSIVFSQLAEQNNSSATDLFTSYCQQVALLCFNLQCLLDLEKIVIGGGISQQPRLIEVIQVEYQKIFRISSMTQQTIPQISIEAAQFQDNANVIGAAKGANIYEVSK
ncbi:ROK family protein [Enterococcus faecalis]